MTVGRDYMLEQPSHPSMPKRFLNTQIIPYTVNVAGGLESTLDRMAVRTGLRPIVILIGGVAISIAAGMMLRRNRSATAVSLKD